MIWDYIKEHFGKSESWGELEKMNGLLLLLLSAIRELSGLPMIIHCGYDSAGHASKSQHYLGNAVDFHFISTRYTFYEQAELLEKILKGLQVWDRVGIGIYPAWNNPGFHLDVRGTHAEWGWTGQRVAGKQVYCSYGEAKEFAEGLKV